MRRITLFGLGLLIAVATAVALLPLRWVTSRYLPGLEASAVTGSIWDGRIRGARYLGFPVGDVDAGLRPGPLLRGEAEISFQRLGEPLAGNATLSRQARRVSDVTGSVTLPVPVAGGSIVLGLDDVALETNRQGQCVAVSGTISATMARIPVIGEIPPLVGQPRCDGETLHAPMQLADRSVGLDLRLSPTGGWQADLGLRNLNPLTSAMLEIAGFARTADGVAIRLAGTIDQAAAGDLR